MGLKDWIKKILIDESEEEKDEDISDEMKDYKKKYDKLLKRMFNEKREDFEKEIKKFETVVISRNQLDWSRTHYFGNEIIGYSYPIKSTSEGLNKAYNLALKNLVHKKFFTKEETLQILALIGNFYPILNMYYDLGLFRINIQNYDNLHSKDKNKREAALLILKQIWMDKIDISKGSLSIKTISEEKEGFQELINAFFLVGYFEEISDFGLINKEIDKLDLNEEINKILREKILEFYKWKEESEEELRNRIEMEEKLYKKVKKDTDNIMLELERLVMKF